MFDEKSKIQCEKFVNYNIRSFIGMEENIFVEGQYQSTGILLYESHWKATKESAATSVAVYTHAIKWVNRHLPFTFNLRFQLNDDFLIFYIEERQTSFQLVQGDAQEWRKVLSKVINQVGFHEHYKPIKKIGKGNFASVYLAEKMQEGTKFAVKAFSKEAAYSEENGKQCLIKEIQIMRHLNGPHNMKLSEVYESQNSLYIIFELLEGGQLFEKIKAKEKFRSAQIKKMISGILEGLREMHSKNIMHRDLKPQNILFRSAGSYDCVIADYGLAEFADQEEYLFVRCGTPGYVAPEVINIRDMKAKYTTSCDMFSLGLILHLLLMGRSVFKGKSFSEVLDENRACNFDLCAEEYDLIDQLAMDLLRKMLKLDPEERITAEQAASHPYFKQSEEDEEEIAEMMDQCKISEQSSILSSANEKKKQERDIKRDSCLYFKMAPENIFTGKTETVGSVPSAKVSGFGAGLLKGLKVSKFVKPVQSKEN